MTKPCFYQMSLRTSEASTNALLRRQVGRLPRQKNDSAQESRLVCARWSGAVRITGGRATTGMHQRGSSSGSLIWFNWPEPQLSRPRSRPKCQMLGRWHRSVYNCVMQHHSWGWSDHQTWQNRGKHDANHIQMWRRTFSDVDVDVEKNNLRRTIPYFFQEVHNTVLPESVPETEFFITILQMDFEGLVLLTGWAFIHFLLTLHFLHLTHW